MSEVASGRNVTGAVVTPLDRTSSVGAELQVGGHFASNHSLMVNGSEVVGLMNDDVADGFAIVMQSSKTIASLVEEEAVSNQSKSEQFQALITSIGAPFRAIMQVEEFALSQAELEQRQLANQTAATLILYMTNPSSKILQFLQGYVTPTDPYGFNLGGKARMTTSAPQILGYIFGKLTPAYGTAKGHQQNKN